jgi:hypothetical protein
MRGSRKRDQARHRREDAVPGIPRGAGRRERKESEQSVASDASARVAAGSQDATLAASPEPIGESKGAATPSSDVAARTSQRSNPSRESRDGDRPAARRARERSDEPRPPKPDTLDELGDARGV